LQYLLNYVLLGAAALIVLVEIIDSGLWRRLGLALLFMCTAISDLAIMHAQERKRAERGAAPDTGRV
jgi:hypothetical protein